tara:strand:- start:40 stop:204 length:165 start_codon:yes stop_codon:yes gene_type:complete
MKKQFRPIYKKEELLLLDKDFLAEIICSLERDRHNLEEEISEQIKWFSEILKKK